MIIDHDQRSDSHRRPGENISDEWKEFQGLIFNPLLRMNVPGKLGILSTIAGSGQQGYSGDNSSAFKSQLFAPVAVAIDSSGNLFIADAGNKVIRYIDQRSGNIRTLASSFTNISAPLGVAVDLSENVYVSDWNSVVWKISKTWSVVTIYVGIPGDNSYRGDGGPATLASLQHPSGIAIDSINSYLYIADWGNNVIRRVMMNNGIISTVVGDSKCYGWAGDGGLATKACMHSPVAVAVDADGNLFISEDSNNVIRKVYVSTGQIYTIAGNVTSSVGVSGGFWGDGAAATSARFHEPSSIAVDPAGNIFIADKDNNRIRVVNASNCMITTVVGGGSTLGDGGPATSGQLKLPAGIAIIPASNNALNSGTSTTASSSTSVTLFIADTGNNRIRAVKFPLSPQSPSYSSSSLSSSSPDYCALPSVSPTPQPSTLEPTYAPTTSQPSISFQPTAEASPSQAPSVIPSRSTTKSPTKTPTGSPAAKLPTREPSSRTSSVTGSPTVSFPAPSNSLTAAPSSSATAAMRQVSVTQVSVSLV
jgi:NHL repeat